MKLLKLATIASSLIAAQAFAQGGDATLSNVEAKVEFVAPIQGEIIHNMDFGILTTAWTNAAHGTITLDDVDKRTAHADIEVFSDDRNAQPAELKFYGWTASSNLGSINIQVNGGATGLTFNDSSNTPTAAFTGDLKCADTSLNTCSASMMTAGGYSLTPAEYASLSHQFSLGGILTRVDSETLAPGVYTAKFDVLASYE